MRSIDFRSIVPFEGSAHAAFEELCCQLARRVEGVLPEMVFTRYRGAGGDGGVECVWTRGLTEWGWQAKYVFDDLPALLRQLDGSLTTALATHRYLDRYVVCIPFNLTGATSRGEGQQQKFAAWKHRWEQSARERRPAFTIELWDASTLVERLIAIDPDGGRRRFWFEANVLPPELFRKHIAAALTAAGPRYTPELNVETVLPRHVHAVADGEEWEARRRMWAERLDRAWETWHQWIEETNRRTKGDYDGRALFSVAAAISRARQCVQGLGRGARSQLDELRAVAGEAVTDAKLQYEAELTNLRSTYAEVILETRSFAKSVLSEIVAVRDSLAELKEWSLSREVEANVEGALVVTGAAGVGKTHALCDVAAERMRRGTLSLLLFGDRFRDRELWPQIVELLGLDATWSRPALLSALDTAAEASGRPLLVIIDAVNESPDRAMWRRRLADLVVEIRAYPWLRLCVSCRTSFVDLCIGRELEVPAYEHLGFAEEERALAIETFFRYVKLQPPVTQILHPGFSNPLFLKLICSALRDSGHATLPPDWMSIGTAIREMVKASGDRYAAAHGKRAGAARLQRVLDAFIDACITTGRMVMPYLDAHEAVVRNAGSDAGEALDWLISDDFLSTIPHDRGEVAVRVSYERLGDHLVADWLLRDVTADGIVPALTTGSLSFLIASAEAVNAHRGVIEALSIRLPERYGIELLDVPAGDDVRRILTAIFEESLDWRFGDAITPRTAELIEALLRDPVSAKRVIPALLSAVLRGGTLDAPWLHRFLSARSMPDRDTTWTAAINQLHGDRRVVRVLEPHANAPAELVRAWATVLCWLFTASDRRVRDRATRAAVVVTERVPAVWADVIADFSGVDDEYVIERCLVAAYGALLLSRDRAAIEATARSVDSLIDARPGLLQHAQIRDHARCLLSLAAGQDVVIAATEDRSPIVFAEEDPLARFEDEEDAVRGYLLWSLRDGSFMRDRVPEALKECPRPIAAAKAKRWLQSRLVEMGWSPEQFAGESEMLLADGEGAGRDRWRERISEKYLRIALAHLVGRLYARSRRRTDPLIARKLREMDPSDLSPNPRDDDRAWWMPLTIELGEERSPAEWFDALQNPLTAQTLQPVTDPRGTVWTVLDLQRFWNREERRRFLLGGRASATLWIRTFVVAREQLDAFLKRVKQHFTRSVPLPRELSYSHCYVGEYPFSTAIDDLTPVTPHSIVEDLGFHALPAADHVYLGYDDDSFSNYAKRIGSCCVPARRFFEQAELRWNGRGGYVDGERVVFLDPAMTEAGPHALLVDRAWFADFLRTRGLVAVSIARVEKSMSENYSTPVREHWYERAEVLGAKRKAIEYSGWPGVVVSSRKWMYLPVRKTYAERRKSRSSGRGDAITVR